ncbi:PREDICTED: uncharacterized protein LOC106314215 [Brassica oleracea var. oleracea]|uniref:uncharacterized protein LOC106314215 n=1 Tax=Brassica oleracea var. oleracea TaxID=109376 RepID=UPI0006A756A3|nr:PREDICTED: uncharacterized protein LOC106314215 [Brassica oleracea var. oleracea]
MRSIARQFIQVEVGNGSHTSFWHEVWSQIGCLKEVVGDRGIIALGIANNATMADVISNHRRRRHGQIILNDIEDEIDRLRVGGLDDKDDVKLWKWGEGKFVSKLSSKKTWCEVSIKLALGVKGVQKTCQHLFFQCPYSTEVWESLVKGLLRDDFTTYWDDIGEMVSGRSYPPTKMFLIRYSLQVAVHSIWRERNGRRHGEEPKAAAILSKLIDKTIRLLLLDVKATGHAYLERSLRTWFGTRQVPNPT